MLDTTIAATHVVKKRAEPGTRTDELCKPRPRSRGNIFFAIVDFGPLEMHSCLGTVSCQLGKWLPGVSIPLLCWCSSSRDSAHHSHYQFCQERHLQPLGPGGGDSRHVVGSSPGRRIFNVVVPWHVFRCNGDLVSRVFRQQQGCGQASDTRADFESGMLWTWRQSSRAHPTTTMFLSLIVATRP